MIIIFLSSMRDKLHTIQPWSLLGHLRNDNSNRKGTLISKGNADIMCMSLFTIKGITKKMRIPLSRLFPFHWFLSTVGTKHQKPSYTLGLQCFLFLGFSIEIHFFAPDRHYNREESNKCFFEGIIPYHTCIPTPRFVHIWPSVFLGPNLYDLNCFRYWPISRIHQRR